jgi:hypothetical protein
VFYKNRFASATTLLNLYMIYGGTNFGGIAHPGVYTSYDYGSAIAEDRTLREKYYELKLQAHFYTRSAAWLTSRPTNVGAEAGAFTGNEALAVTQTRDMIGNATAFYTIASVDALSFLAGRLADHTAGMWTHPAILSCRISSTSRARRATSRSRCSVVTWS